METQQFDLFALFVLVFGLLVLFGFHILLDVTFFDLAIFYKICTLQGSIRGHEIVLYVTLHMSVELDTSSKVKQYCSMGKCRCQLEFNVLAVQSLQVTLKFSWCWTHQCDLDCSIQNSNSEEILLCHYSISS
jgi:hypothetical protein